eukprot:Hpha_TRINITY_DN11187_c0_g1::TRINITY_DN11187_c0_g1_i1::g.28133::m.28133
MVCCRMGRGGGAGGHHARASAPTTRGIRDGRLRGTAAPFQGREIAPQLTEATADAAVWPLPPVVANRTWPGLERDEDGLLRPRVFPVLSAPLQVSHVWRLGLDGGRAKRVVAAARERCFEPFLREASKVVQGINERVLWGSEPHVVVSVFQEHPDLLPTAERAQFRQVPTEAMAGLRTEVGRVLKCYESPSLSVD